MATSRPSSPPLPVTRGPTDTPLATDEEDYQSNLRYEEPSSRIKRTANELLQDTKARALAQARTMAQARSLAQAQYQRPELTDKELEELSVPPVPLDGGLLEVNFRLTIHHISKVDTPEQHAHLRMGIVLYWTDPRMARWSHPILPPTLWGPDLWLRNSVGGVEVEYEQFVVVGVEEGRLKRILNFDATVLTPMDLRHFPFDNQVISPEWVSISHWKQFDGSRFGSLPQGQSYCLRPVTRPNEGQHLMIFFNGIIPEWSLHSYTAKVSSAANTAGFTLSRIKVKFHIARKHEYYLTKTVVPLVTLAIGSHLVHFLPPDLLGDRLANTFTMFLAAFALLYVIGTRPGYTEWNHCRQNSMPGDHVPRVDFLTTIDWVVYLTLLTLMWLGLESGVVYYLWRAEGFEHAVWLDRGLGGCVVLIYCAAIVRLILPAVRRQKQDLKRVERENREEHEKEVASARLEGRSSGMANESFSTPAKLQRALSVGVQPSADSPSVEPPSVEPPGQFEC